MIKSLTVCVPNEIVDRSHINPENLAKFEKVTGIKKTRRFTGESTIAMIEAAIQSMPGPFPEYQAIVVVTQSPDELSPCVATAVHAMLNQPPSTVAFDINHACDGWLVGLSVAERFGGDTLLVCVDRLRFGSTDTEKLIFSDSVSFTEVQPCGGIKTAAIYSCRNYTDGENRDKLYCSISGEMFMDGNFIFDFVTSKIPDLVKYYEADNVDYLVPHQANLSMNRILEARCGYKDKTLYSIEEYGNLSMNSVPMTIAHNEEKVLGKRLIACGFGAGLSAATMMMDWASDKITKVVEF